MVSSIILATLLVTCTGQAVRFPQNEEVVETVVGAVNEAVVEAVDDAVVIYPELDPKTHQRKELHLQMLRGRRLSNRHSHGHGPGHIHLTSERENMVDAVWSKDLCGDGSPYCSSPLHYPQELIARAVKKSSAMKWIPPLFDPPPKAQPRFGAGLLDEFEFENVCQSSKTTIAPRVGTNTKNQQRYLVNGGVDLAEFDSLVRTINIVTCLGSQEQGEKEQCSGVRGRRSECRQEYTEHKMVALDQEKGELVVETFSFPSCCSCMLKVQ